MSVRSSLRGHAVLLTRLLEGLVLVTQNSKLRPNISAPSSFTILLHGKKRKKETHTSSFGSKMVASLDGQVTPSRNETPRKVAMREDHDVGIVDLVCILSRIFGLCVESSDFGDDTVDPSGHLCGGFPGGLTGRAAGFKVGMSEYIWEEGYE